MNYEMYRNVKHRQSPARSKRNHFQAAGAVRSADKKRKEKLIADCRSAGITKRAAQDAGIAAAKATQEALLKGTMLSEDEIEKISIQNGLKVAEAILAGIEGA